MGKALIWFLIINTIIVLFGFWKGLLESIPMLSYIFLGEFIGVSIGLNIEDKRKHINKHNK